jgi:N6-adenosine-specific RNA methylase IME4
LSRIVLSADFATRVRALVVKGKAVVKAQRTSVILFLEFCRDYAALHRNASPEERAYLHQQTGIDEPSLRSAYRRIGEQYGVLKRHASALPPSQESIKELARMESRRPGVLAKLVARDVIHRDVSVFTVRNHVRRILPTRNADLPSCMDLPTRHYSVIYVDPPWSYENDASHGAAVNHYQTMSLDDLRHLPVQQMAAHDCALFMWATMPLLRQAFELIDAWGFEYRTTAFTWVKRYPRNFTKWFMGTGNYTRSNAELCLLAIRGRPRVMARDVSSVVEAPVGRHSEKPHVVRERIGRLMGARVRKIELFARRKYEGWDVWGNEAPDACEPALW